MKHFICLLIVVFGWNLIVRPAQNDEGKIIEPIRNWSGKKVSSERLKAEPEKAYVSDQAEWEKLWRAWRASEDAAPSVDFTKNLVAFCTAQTPNSCGIKLLLSKTGDLRIENFSTLIGGDSTTFDYQFVEFSRAGVKTINNQPVGGNDAAASQNSADNKPAATNKYALFGKIQAKSGKGRELTEMLLAGTKTLERAKGCLLYLISRKPDEPDAVYVMEVSESREDHQNSLKIPAVREVIKQAMPLIERVPEGITLEVLGGKGFK